MRIVEPSFTMSILSILSTDGTRTSTKSNGKYPGFGRLDRQFKTSERPKYPPPRDIMPGMDRWFATALRGDGSLALDSSERKADQSIACPIFTWILGQKGQNQNSEENWPPHRTVNFSESLMAWWNEKRNAKKCEKRHTWKINDEWRTNWRTANWMFVNQRRVI